MASNLENNSLKFIRLWKQKDVALIVVQYNLEEKQLEFGFAKNVDIK